jgi:L-ascorbate metabolism protein UlaG (beta-lactamase superfamily)
MDDEMVSNYTLVINFKTYIMKKLTIFFALVPLVFSSAFAQVKPNELKITYVANEGFVFQTLNRKFMIDALFSDGYGLFATPPAEVVNQIMGAQPPFDQITHYFLTHYHRDHCDPKLVKEYLAKNPTVKLVTNKPAITFIDGCEFRFVKLKGQFMDMTPDPDRGVTQRIGDGTIRAIAIKHLPYIEDGVNLEELMFSVSYYMVLDGIKIFHSGDIATEGLKDYITKNAGWKDNIDVACLYYEMLVGEKQDFKYLVKTLNPKYIVVMHVPPTKYDEISQKIEQLKSAFPNIIMFKNPLESQTLKLK